MDIVIVGGFMRIRRRLPMWQVCDCRMVHWVRTRQDVSWGDARGRHFRCRRGAVWMAVIPPEERRRVLVFVPAGAHAQVQIDLEQQGCRVVAERLVWG